MRRDASARLAKHPQQLVRAFAPRQPAHADDHQPAGGARRAVLPPGCDVHPVGQHADRLAATQGAAQVGRATIAHGSPRDLPGEPAREEIDDLAERRRAEQRMHRDHCRHARPRRRGRVEQGQRRKCRQMRVDDVVAARQHSTAGRHRVPVADAPGSAPAARGRAKHRDVVGQAVRLDADRRDHLHVVAPTLLTQGEPMHLHLDAAHTRQVAVAHMRDPKHRRLAVRSEHDTPNAGPRFELATPGRRLTIAQSR